MYVATQKAQVQSQQMLIIVISLYNCHNHMTQIIQWLPLYVVECIYYIIREYNCQSVFSWIKSIQIALDICFKE